MSKVFVSDAQNRKTLATIRSLAKKGIEITAGDVTSFAPSRFSKYCKKFVVYPSPQKYPEKFCQFLIKLFKNDNYDVFLPMDDETILVAAKFKDELSKYVRIPIADLRILMKGRNKTQTLKLAMSQGIPCPKTWFIENLDNLEAIKNNLEYPLVIKPQESSGSRGIIIVDSSKKLLNSYKRVHRWYPWPMIQEFIPQNGKKYQVSALFDYNSEPKAVFVQEIIRQYPVNRGADTLSRGVYNSEIKKLGIKLLRYLNWYGVAGVEFIVDPRDNIAKLMEINPRFWASLQLAISSGIDFPYLLYQMATNGEIQKTDGYRTDRMYRWLLPGDILSFFSDPNRLARKPSFFDFSNGNNTTYAILSRDDIGPVFGFAFSCLRHLFDRQMWRHTIKRI